VDNKESRRAYYLANRDLFLSRAKNWAEQNRDRRREINREFASKNKEQAKERFAKWIAKPENQQKRRDAAKRRYHAKKLQQTNQ
jgi:hypothetical protein